jgi:HTH-type transcriptional regulator / antitoxin HipB
MDYPLRLADQLKHQLRSLRKARGWTQTQLGQRLGVGQVRIADIEKNPAAISVDQLFKLLAALDTHLVLRENSSQPPLQAMEPQPEPRQHPGDAPLGDVPKGSW